MTTITEDELTKLAVQELLKDAKRFQDKRDAEFRATQMKMPMKPNKPFLKNTLRDVLSFNRKKSEKPTQSSRSKSRKLLKKESAHKFIGKGEKSTTSSKDVRKPEKNKDTKKHQKDKTTVCKK